MFPVKRNKKKSLVKIVEHKLEETVSDVIWDVHLECFILLSVPISQQLSRLTSLYFFSFLNRPLKLDCTFPWQHSGGSEQLFTPVKLEIILLQVTSYNAPFIQFSPELSAH